MSGIYDAQNAINTAIDALVARRTATSDAGEQAQILDAIRQLQAQRAALDQQELAAAAQAVGDAARRVEGFVASARGGPFDGCVAALESAVDRLKGAEASLRTQTDRGG